MNRLQDLRCLDESQWCALKGLCIHSGLTSSDEDDLSSKTGDVGIWVEAGRRHCFSWCDGEVEEWK